MHFVPTLVTWNITHTHIIMKCMISHLPTVTKTVKSVFFSLHIYSGNNFQLAVVSMWTLLESYQNLGVDLIQQIVFTCTQKKWTDRQLLQDHWCHCQHEVAHASVISLSLYISMVNCILGITFHLSENIKFLTANFSPKKITKVGWHHMSYERRIHTTTPHFLLVYKKLHKL